MNHSRPIIISSCALGVLLAVTLPRAEANVGDTYGFGSRTASLAGAGVAWGSDGFASYANPSMMSWFSDQKSRLKFSYAWLYMHPSFTPIENVVVENQYTSDLPAGQTRRDTVSTDYRNTVGQALGLTYLVAPEFHQLSLGVTTFVPFEQLAYIDTGETFIPEYVLHRSRTQRPQVELAASGLLTRHFSFGAGLHFGTALTSTGTVFVQTNATQPSTLRIASSAKTKVVPYFGLSYNSDPEQDHPTSTLGLVYRFPLSSSNQLTMKSSARALGNLAALDFNFSALSTLYYDPASIELGTTFAYSDHARFYLQADYQLWSKFEAPAVSIQDPQTTNCNDGSACGIRISSGKNPAYSYRNILIPRIAHEWKKASLSLRLGYGYRPSILKAPSSGAGNYLDPPKHLLSAGLGIAFKKFLHFDTPCELNFHGSYQALVTQQIVKDPGDELGSGSGDLKIGAPGYEAGGKIFGGGVSLSLTL